MRLRLTSRTRRAKWSMRGITGSDRPSILERDLRGTFLNAGAGEVTAAWRYRFVERALSQNTHPSPSGTSEPVSVRTLTAPTRSEIEALAELFDKYRAHYGEASCSSQAIGWLEQNLSTHLRAFVAEDSGRFVGFAITMEVPASCGSPTSGRSETFSSCRRTVVVESVVPFSAPSERLQSRRRTPPSRADRGRQRPRSPSLHRQRLRADQRLLLTDAADSPGNAGS